MTPAAPTVGSVGPVRSRGLSPPVLMLRPCVWQGASQAPSGGGRAEQVLPACVGVALPSWQQTGCLTWVPQSRWGPRGGREGQQPRRAARRGPFPLPLSTGPGRGGAGTPWLWGPAGTFGARRSAPGSYSQGCCAGEEHTHRVPVPCPALEKELSGWRELFAAHGSCVLGPPASLQADQGQQARGQEATVVSGALRLLSPPPSSAAEKGPWPSSAPSGCRPRLQWWHLDGCHRPPAPPVPRLAPCPPGLAGDLQVNHRLCPRPPLFLSLFCAARFPAATDSAEATSSANASGASGAVRGGRGATGRPREPLSSPSSLCPPSRSGLCRLPGCQSDVV